MFLAEPIDEGARAARLPNDGKEEDVNEHDRAKQDCESKLKNIRNDNLRSGSEVRK